MKYQTVEFFGHKEYQEFLESNDIEIAFLHILPDYDNVRIIVTWRPEN